jgi:uroporphyrinogen decarboxylase
MDSRERTFLSLDHQEPDRVPLDCWASHGTKRKIESAMHLSYGAFLDKYDIDLRYIQGPEYIGPGLGIDGDLERDVWGVIRKPVVLSVSDGNGKFEEIYKEVVKSPLETCTSMEEILAYKHWPSADWFDYSSIERQCDDVRNKGRVVVFMGDRLNRFAQLKPAMYLRGMGQFFIDMAESNEIADAIIEQIVSFYIAYETRILEAASAKIDILVTGDDFGMQDGMMVSPAMWRNKLKKGFAEYIKVAKDHGARVMHHTCGSVDKIIDDFIECGLDILQSIQPEASGMAPAYLKSAFGKRISFQGGISIQKVLPFMNVDDVRSHAASVLEQMMPGGGYIAGTAHNIQADTSIEKIKALFEAYHHFGSYQS